MYRRGGTAMAPPCLLFAILCALACRRCCCLSSAIALTLAPAPVHEICPDILTLSSLRDAPPDNATLLLAVPWKVGFGDLVSFRPGNCSIGGFSVEVFRSALQYVQDPRLRNFRFVLLGDGIQTPSYNGMLDLLLNKTVDGVVADLTINRERAEKVGFTVPYLASSLVMITTLKSANHGSFWDFLRPFSKQLWASLLACLVATGAVLYLLEDKNPDFSKTSKKREGGIEGSSHGGPSLQGQDIATSPINQPPLRVRSIRDNYNHLFVQDATSLQRPGPPIYDETSRKRRILNAYWFICLCVFQSQQESVRTHLGRIATVMWLFAMLIFNASYTASLASILSAQSGTPRIASFQALLSNTNITVGCQEGSFMKSYMKNLKLTNHPIKTFNSTEQYVDALQKGSAGGDGAGTVVLDETVYTGKLLRSHCDLTKISRDDENLPSFGGLGFAFRKGDPLIDELSKIIVHMAENGTLKELQNTWNVGDADGDGCNSDTSPSNLELQSFVGLFAIVAVVYILCVIWRWSTKTIKSPEQSCGMPIHSLPCSRPQTMDVSLSLSSYRVSDDPHENQSSLVTAAGDGQSHQEASHS